MGFLDSIFGSKKPPVESLIKSLAMQRMAEGGFPDLEGMRQHIESLSAFQLAGIPESTIDWIVRAYISNKKTGVPDRLIFQTIENHRVSNGGPSGVMPGNLTLNNYIKYRIEIEHSGDFMCPQDHQIDRCISALLAYHQS
jgi:hypothetical protein